MVLLFSTARDKWVPVITAWPVLRLRMEDTACRRGVSLRMYSMSSRVQLTRGGSPARWFGEGLPTPRSKKIKMLPTGMVSLDDVRA